jgi:transposase
MTYPLSFRKQVMKIKDKENLSNEQTAIRFGVGLATVSRWKYKLGRLKDVIKELQR